MTEERNLLYLHKMLHEQAKHKQGDLKDLQTEQVKNMQKLLCLLAIEDGFAGFVKSQNRDFLAEAPNTCPEEAEIEALKAAGITALCFPCIRIADNGKSAKGMWLAETADGLKPIAAEFLRWGAEWKLWKLILEPTTDNLPYEPYERCYPDPKEKPVEKPAFGGPGGPPPMGGPGGPPPMGGPGGPGGPPPGGPGGPPPGGPGGPGGGEDQPPFDPDARSDVLSIEGDYARLSSDIHMLTNMALPDYRKGCEAAEQLLEQCRRVVMPEYAAQRVRRVL